jgi:hypothetical protein
MFGMLAEYTFYWQNFFKTRYVFGFGRTEDVPVGLSITATAGVTRQSGLERLYLASGWNHSFANRSGNFFSYGLEVGGYPNNDQLEDALVKANASYGSRAVNLNRYKLRALVAGTYTRLINQTVFNLIPITSSDIRGFSADSVRGDSKILLRVENVLYTPWILLGFRFAPFVGLSNARLACKTCAEANTSVWAISGGFRTRNENLIFGTMELRLTFALPTETTDSQFSFDFTQRLRTRNTRSFVRPPSLLRP